MKYKIIEKNINTNKIKNEGYEYDSYADAYEEFVRWAEIELSGDYGNDFARDNDISMKVDGKSVAIDESETLESIDNWKWVLPYGLCIDHNDGYRTEIIEIK